MQESGRVYMQLETAIEFENRNITRKLLEIKLNACLREPPVNNENCIVYKLWSRYINEDFHWKLKLSSDSVQRCQRLSAVVWNDKKNCRRTKKSTRNKRTPRMSCKRAEYFPAFQALQYFCPYTPDISFTACFSVYTKERDFTENTNGYLNNPARNHRDRKI